MYKRLFSEDAHRPQRSVNTLSHHGDNICDRCKCVIATRFGDFGTGNGYDAITWTEFVDGGTDCFDDAGAIAAGDNWGSYWSVDAL